MRSVTDCPKVDHLRQIPRLFRMRRKRVSELPYRPKASAIPRPPYPTARVGEVSVQNRFGLCLIKMSSSDRGPAMFVGL